MSSESSDTSTDSSSTQSMEKNIIEDQSKPDISQEQLQQIDNLQKFIISNPNDYSSYLQLIEALKQAEWKDKLREQRVNFYLKFPLQQQQWLEWINDELQDVQDENDIDEIKELFEKAVQDYLSVQLWQEYLKFIKMSADMSSEDDVEDFREACERALQQCKYHVTEGHEIWTIYRDFEQELLDSLLEQEQQQDTPELQMKIGYQIQKVRNVYQQELSLPIQGIEELYAKYNFWENSLKNGGLEELPAKFEKSYRSAKQGLTTRTGMEQLVKESSTDYNELYNIYLKYIELERKIGTKEQVKCLCERAISVVPSNSDLWLSYCTYLEQKQVTQNTPETRQEIKQVYQRAVRNCNWVGTIWARYIQAMERCLAPDDELQSILDQALLSGIVAPDGIVEVFLARVDSLRRQKEKAYDKTYKFFDFIIQYMKTNHPDYQDTQIHLYYAQCKVYNTKSPKEGFPIMEDILKSPMNKYYDTWKQVVNFYLTWRSQEEARKLYNRAHSLKLENSGEYYLCLDWLKFERENGGPEDYFRALLKVQPIIEKYKLEYSIQSTQITQQGNQYQDYNQQYQDNQQNQQNKHQKSQDNAKRKREQQENNKKGKKQKQQQQTNKKQKQQKQDNNNTANDQQGQEIMDIDTQQQNSNADKNITNNINNGVQSLESNGAKNDEDKQQTLPSETVNEEVEDNVVFVRGLNWHVTEQQLHEHFVECGPIKEIRLARDKDSGRSRGFAYIEYMDKQGVEEAIKLDGKQMRGRNLFIAKSRPPKKEQKQKREQKVKQLQQEQKNKEILAASNRAPPMDRKRKIDDEYGSYQLQDEGSNDAQGTPPKSNEQFRKMLLGNK